MVRADRARWHVTRFKLRMINAIDAGLVGLLVAPVLTPALIHHKNTRTGDVVGHHSCARMPPIATGPATARLKPRSISHALWSSLRKTSASFQPIGTVTTPQRVLYAP